MTVELKVPEVGESITEVQVGTWLKAVGDIAEPDEGLVEIETDKVSFELPAPVRGKITKVLKAAGDPAVVGEIIGYLEPAEAGAAPAAPETPEPAPEQVEGVTPAKEPIAGGHVMPAAKRVMAEHGVAEGEVAGTGPGGRILKEDVERHVREFAPAPAAAPRPSVASHPGGGEEEVVPMSPLRKRVAERLVSAQQTMALLTTFNEIDMTAVKTLRKEHGPTFLDRYGIKLGFMSFFVKATVDALKAVPALNAEIRDEEIVYKNHYDIGVAVGGGKGLVVPVVRGADRMSFSEVEQKISEYAEKAQANRLDLAELTGGTFTISNGGVYGSLLSTPIVNPPQSGILGLHGIQERPIGIDGEIALRPMMYVAVTYDHRIVDGREAVMFLRRIKDCIENPTRMLLEI